MVKQVIAATYNTIFRTVSATALLLIFNFPQQSGSAVYTVTTALALSCSLNEAIGYKQQGTACLPC